MLTGKRIAAAVVVLLILAGATSLMAYPARVSPQKAEEIARDFIHEALSGPQGVILTSGKVKHLWIFPSYYYNDLLSSGVLSETVGLVMVYAALSGDRKLFDQQMEFSKTKLIGQYGLFHWKVSYDGELVSNSSAVVDDLRIIQASLLAYEKWKDNSYLDFAKDEADNVGQYEVVDSVLRDFWNWRDYGQPMAATSLQLSYIDTATMKQMIRIDPEWEEILEKTGDVLLNGQLESGLFYEYFDFKDQGYRGEKQNMINQLYCALFAAEIEGDKHPFADWMIARFKQDGKLYAQYNSNTGEPTEYFESTAVYALAARYALKIKDKRLCEQLIARMMKFQHLNRFSKMYGGFFDDEVYSFDNLEALISLRLHNDAC